MTEQMKNMLSGVLENLKDERDDANFRARRAAVRKAERQAEDARNSWKYECGRDDDD